MYMPQQPVLLLTQKDVCPSAQHIQVPLQVSLQVTHAAQQTTVIQLQALQARTFFQWDSFYCPALFIIFTINQSILKTGVNFIRKSKTNI